MRQGEWTYTMDEVAGAAEILIQLSASVQVFGFVGELGAGKTTLIQAFLKGAGVQEPAQSPTFATVITYADLEGHRYHHFDLYRMSSQREFVDGGFVEYLSEPGSLSLIEWPEVIMPLLKHVRPLCMVTLSYLNENQRVMRYEWEMQ